MTSKVDAGGVDGVCGRHLLHHLAQEVLVINIVHGRPQHAKAAAGTGIPRSILTGKKRNETIVAQLDFGLWPHHDGPKLLGL